MKTKLIQTLKPTQHYSLKQVHSLAVLSMSQQELEKTICTLSEENPLLEIHPDFYHNSFEVDFSQLSLSNPTTLVDELVSQINTSKYANKNCAKAIVYHLDEHGYLTTPLQDIKKEAHFPLFELKLALQFVQTLQPLGVGARDLQECLFLQCNQMNTRHKTELLCSLNFLEDLSKGRYRKVAQLCNTTEDIIIICFKLIQTCNPKPGISYSRTLPYIIPEIFITVEDGKILIETRDCSQYISINDEYKNTKDPEVKKYLSKQATVIKQLLAAIKKRNATLHEICTVLMHVQQDYFLYNEPLVPLTYHQVGELIHRHPSTVFRCLQNKALQFNNRVILLSSLFAYEVVNGISSDAIKISLKQLIEDEDKKSPSSDEQLAHMLKDQGIPISRRVIAKYREQLRIPNSSRRKTTSSI